MSEKNKLKWMDDMKDSAAVELVLDTPLLERLERFREALEELGREGRILSDEDGSCYLESGMFRIALLPGERLSGFPVLSTEPELASEDNPEAAAEAFAAFLDNEIVVIQAWRQTDGAFPEETGKKIQAFNRRSECVQVRREQEDGMLVFRQAFPLAAFMAASNQAEFLSYALEAFEDELDEYLLG